MASSQWTLGDLIKSYGPVLARKMAFITLGWVGVYFLSQPFRSTANGINILALFSLVLGTVAGLVIGWYIATDSVEESGLHGLVLWVILVAGAVLPMWITEGILHLLLPKWPVDFGGWMLVSFASLMAMASAVWVASAQE